MKATMYLQKMFIFLFSSETFPYYINQIEKFWENIISSTHPKSFPINIKYPCAGSHFSIRYFMG